MCDTRENVGIQPERQAGRRFCGVHPRSRRTRRTYSRVFRIRVKLKYIMLVLRRLVFFFFFVNPFVVMCVITFPDSDIDSKQLTRSDKSSSPEVFKLFQMKSSLLLYTAAIIRPLIMYAPVLFLGRCLSY